MIVGLLTASASSGLSTLSVVTGLAATAIAIMGGVITYLIRRRNTTGRIGTSEASTLWTQSQAMRDTLLQEKLKAEDQRDKLMGLQTNSVIPMMTEVTTTMRSMKVALENIYIMLDARTPKFDDLERGVERLEQGVERLEQSQAGLFDEIDNISR